MNIQGLTVEEVIPHSRKMVLLDELESADDSCLVASLTIREESYFLQNNTVPAWIGIEYMAQAIAAYAGVLAKKQGEKVKVGLLLGTRRYSSKVSNFILDQKLFVSVKPLHNDESGLGVFECGIYPATDAGLCAEEPWVVANLNVYQPHDVEAFLAGER